MVVIHVWNEQSKYVGTIARSKPGRFHVDADEEEKAKLTEALMDSWLNPRSPGKPVEEIHIRVGDRDEYVEFASDEWLAIAALMLLPDRGYRVHVIKTRNGA